MVYARLLVPTRVRSMRYSAKSWVRSLLFLCAVLCAGCAGRLSPEESERQGFAQASYLIERYGALDGEAVRGYIAYLESRLINGFHAEEQAGRRFSFVMIDGDEPMAFSPGAGYVIFSRGLALSLRSEAELAFALAHELAHQYLGHTDLPAENFRSEAADGTRRQLELEADSYALGVVAVAGYDPRMAVQALLNAYRYSDIDGQDASYPDLQARIENITKLVARSGWTPPGTVNRRAFNVFQAGLRG